MGLAPMQRVQRWTRDDGFAALLPIPFSERPHRLTSDPRNPHQARLTRNIAVIAAMLATAMHPALGNEDSKLPSSKPSYRTELVDGKVVWLGNGLKRRFGISTSLAPAEGPLALETPKGELFPIVEDVRGHAFRVDERLRNKTMSLLVRRYQRHPLLQIIRVYELKEGKRFEVDYWCDVCAIVMFEKGQCACCQDQNRLRHRLAPLKDSEKAGPTK